MVAFLYRMPAGIPGDVTRPSQSTIEPAIIDATTPPTSYGIPVKLVSGKVQPLAGGEAATAIYGLLARPYPTNAGTDPLGTSTPPVAGPCDILRRGYMSVQLRAGTAAKGGTVYVRVAAAASGKPIGGIEAAADSTNTVVLAAASFMGAADASGVTEIAYNI